MKSIYRERRYYSYVCIYIIILVFFTENIVFNDRISQYSLHYPKWRGKSHKMRGRGIQLKKILTNKSYNYSFHYVLFPLFIQNFILPFSDEYPGCSKEEWMLQARFIYFSQCPSFDLESLLPWIPKRTASASSIDVSIAAPINLDVSSTSNNCSWTVVPNWYFLSIHF